MGYRGTDEQLCRKYWGLNPMPYFLMICPSCKHISWPSEFEQLEGEPDESLPQAEPSCDSFEKYIQVLITQNAEPSMIAYASQQSGCCRRINGEDSTEQFKRAAEYFRKAKESGTKDVGDLTIDEWIKRMDDALVT